MQKLKVLLLLVGLFAVVGCPAETQDPSAADTEQPSADTPAKINLSLASWASIEEEISNNQGKVVVVDLWSTSCAPCKREFPHLVELQQQYGPEKVTCIGVSLDYYGDKTEPPESFRPAVEKFLREQQATFTNFVCTDSSDDVYTKVESFGVPIVMVYGTDGELAKLFEDDGTYGDEGFTYHDHIEPLVEKLLADAS